jgi:antitoxin PrlF
MSNEDISYAEISMGEAKITSKWQVTIPKEIRDKMGLRKGERILFDEKDGIVFLKKVHKTGAFEKWAGFLKEDERKSPDAIIEKLRAHVKEANDNVFV